MNWLKDKFGKWFRAGKGERSLMLAIIILFADNDNFQWLLTGSVW